MSWAVQHPGLPRSIESVEAYISLLREYDRLVREGAAESEREILLEKITKQKDELSDIYNRLHKWHECFDAMADAPIGEITGEIRKRQRDLATLPLESELSAGGLPMTSFGVPIRGLRHYLEDVAIRCEEEARGRGVSVPPMPTRSKFDEIIEPITTKIQLKIALKTKFDELKRMTPAELHPDLEKSFREAIQQLDK
jgi:hypothetical protein